MEPPRKHCILIVDDDSAVQVSLALLLKQAGYATVCSDDPAQALAALARQPIDLVLQDMNFSLHTSGDEGLQLLAAIKQRYPALPVLLMTAWGSIGLAVRGMQAGAANFFTKPWDNTQLAELVRATLDTLTPHTALATAQAPSPAASHTVERRALDARFDFSGIVGEHPRLLQVLATIGQVAATRAPVLILGESGSGKELVADAIHRNSPRAQQAIVKINMGAITPTLFESEMFGHVRGAFTDAKTDRKGHVASAHEGTLFLDEIGELNRSDQVKLLRVLQDQTFQPVGASRTERADIRVVSATNRELATLVAGGEFREDLFYRLNLITIRLPPLRERRSDIPLLARHIIGEVSAGYGLAPATLAPQALDAQFDFSGIVGEHPRLLKVLSTIVQVAATRAPVLILGESGCGKELVADAIHRNSPRAARPIVKINMGAITPSLFESEMFGHVRGAFTDAKADRKGHVASAHEGTLFLDEIGELNRSDQVKLLRVLQDQTYQPVGASRTERADIRVVSATNKELAALVASGEFREDLFYRLNLITIRLPPLRERRSDIPLLARHIIGEVSASYGLEPATIAPQALDWLSAQPWPGNIRQLKQTLERTLLLVGRSELRQADFVAAEQHEHGGAAGAAGTRLGVDGMTLEQVERHMIAHALEQHQGNISRVAKALGLSRTALYRRLERHGLGGAPDDADAGPGAPRP